MNYNELSKQAHQSAVSKGFWDDQRSEEHFLTMVFTEVAEAVEADREGKRANIPMYLNVRDRENRGVLQKMFNRDTTNAAFVQHVASTLEDEFADIMIRLFDLAGQLQIDFDKLSPCRYYRAFSRFSFTENVFALIKGLCRDQIGIEKRIQFALNYVENWAAALNIDLSFHVTEKMKYNASRGFLHGKSY